MTTELESLRARVDDLERRVKGIMRHGSVDTVDPMSGKVRLKLGRGSQADEKYLSAAVPYAQTGGELKIHDPPTPGQQMVLFCPDGDLRNGIAMPATFRTANPAPGSASDVRVATFGPITITMAAAGVTFEIGGVAINMSAGGLSVTGGGVTHNQVNIGDDHKHGGITPGGSLTDNPQ